MSRLTVATCACGVTAACWIGPVAGRSTALGSSSCPTKPAVVLAESTTARIFALSRTRGVYTAGCIRGSKRRPLPLASPNGCNDFGEMCYVSAVGLRGSVAGYGITDLPFRVIEASATFILRDLRSGQILLSVPAFTNARVSSDTARIDGVRAIVIAGRRAAAWIARNPTAAPERRYEVRKFDAGGLTVLDLSAAIRSDSLRLDGSLLTWVSGGLRRSAPLNRSVAE